MHALSVLAGVLLLTTLFVAEGAHRFSERREAALSAAALYWYFVSGVWILIFVRGVLGELSVTTRRLSADRMGLGAVHPDRLRPVTCSLLHDRAARGPAGRHFCMRRRRTSAGPGLAAGCAGR